MPLWLIVLVSLVYLGILFGLAFFVDKKAKKGQNFLQNPYIYTLSLAVYCTAWTFYGSIGRAAEKGLDFLLIFLGPTLVMPIWWFIFRKVIRICKNQNITTLADFISARYGKSAFLGGLVTLICVLGLIPYITLQIKAITDSIYLLTQTPINQGNTYFFYENYAFYVALLMMVFTILFGTRHIESTYKNNGLVVAVAFESIFKLVAFLILGIFIVYGIFNGMGDIFSKITQNTAQNPDLTKLFTLNGATSQNDWFYLMFASMCAILFLPRQFQMAVIENTNEKHLDKAIWLFPLYLLVINLFVLPIALAGKILFADAGIGASIGVNANPDLFLLTIPLSQNQPTLAILAYLGGFAAATSMIIVETLALSLMLTNNLIVPLSVYFLKKDAQNEIDKVFSAKKVILIRRLSIILVIILVYGHLSILDKNLPLVSLGLISFVAVAQFAPAMIGGLYFKEANAKGAKIGLIAGFLMWLVTLVVPSMAQSQLFSTQFIENGYFGLIWLRPYHLFGIENLSPIAHSLFWSLLFNVFGFIFGTLLLSQSNKERQQAEIFVDIFLEIQHQNLPSVWKGNTEKIHLESLLINFFGKKRTKELLENLTKTESQYADPFMVSYAENMLSGAIGATSARMLIATIAEEEQMSKNEFIKILKESQEIKQLNEKLRQMDEQKNEFITTITHEMRTPITSIRTFSEILYDNPTLEAQEKQHFLQTVIKETERMERLINQVLDLEKYASGKQKFNFQYLQIVDILNECIGNFSQVWKEKNISFETHFSPKMPLVRTDYDRITQVILNLFSNATKFCATENGKIDIYAQYNDNQIIISVTDNGIGIADEFSEIIFEKFYQAENKTIKKPKGSGLGLAICKKIIEYNGGKIWVENKNKTSKNYTKFTFVLPITQI